MRNFRELEIWKEGISITTLIYQLTKTYPKQEVYGLCSQLRRAAVSIPSNIAEGCRGSNKEMMQYLNIAIGSSFEVETQLTISFNLGYIKESTFQETVARLNILQKRINSFRNTLKPTR